MFRSIAEGFKRSSPMNQLKFNIPKISNKKCINSNYSGGNPISYLKKCSKNLTTSSISNDIIYNLPESFEFIDTFLIESFW